MPAARARSLSAVIWGSWAEVVRFGGTATKSWPTPLLTARSTVAAGLLVSQTHIARAFPAADVVLVAARTRAVGAAAAPGATTTTEATTPSSVAAVAAPWGRRARGPGAASGEPGEPDAPDEAVLDRDERNMRELREDAWGICLPNCPDCRRLAQRFRQDCCKIGPKAARAGAHLAARGEPVDPCRRQTRGVQHHMGGRHDREGSGAV